MKALRRDMGIQGSIQDDAEMATREHNEAYATMKDAIRPIKGTVRKRPDLLAKLGI